MRANYRCGLVVAIGRRQDVPAVFLLTYRSQLTVFGE